MGKDRVWGIGDGAERDELYAFVQTEGPVAAKSEGRPVSGTLAQRGHQARGCDCRIESEWGRFDDPPPVSRADKPGALRSYSLRVEARVSSFEGSIWPIGLGSDGV